MSLPYFNFYPKDWLSDPKVTLLTLEEQGAYMRILALMWTYETGDCSLPDDPAIVSQLLGISQKKWRKIREKLVESPHAVLTVEDGKLVNSRLQEEYEKARQKSVSRARSSRSRWSKRSPNAMHLHTKRTPSAMHSESDSDTEASTSSEISSLRSDISSSGATGSVGQGPPEPSVAPDSPPKSNQEVIAELGDEFLEIVGPSYKRRKSVYPAIGAMYLEHGAEAVWSALSALRTQLASGAVIQDPIAYVGGVLKGRGRSRDRPRDDLGWIPMA